MKKARNSKDEIDPTMVSLLESLHEELGHLTVQEREKVLNAMFSYINENPDIDELLNFKDTFALLHKKTMTEGSSA